MKKLLKLLKVLKQIKAIKKLDTNDFHIFRISNDIDCSSMYELSVYLNKQNIKHIMIFDDYDIKSVRAADKKDLLECIKKEIGLEE